VIAKGGNFLGSRTLNRLKVIRSWSLKGKKKKGTSKGDETRRGHLLSGRVMKKKSAFRVRLWIDYQAKRKGQEYEKVFFGKTPRRVRKKK